MARPDSAKAIAGFNLTAAPIGFLQPLFAGDHGDNQTYIQRLDSLTKIAGFEPVAWPERDTVLFDDPVRTNVNDESLWAFTFPNERPAVLPWNRFREFLRERIDSPIFVGHPLLQFDIVQTLDLDEKKPSIFTRAFLKYAQAGNDVAERWRDRAILEPALAEALRSAGIFTMDRRDSVRARLVDGIARIELAEFDPSAIDILDKAYQAIADRYESIFPKFQRVEVLPKPSRQGLPIREAKQVTLVLVGQLRDEDPKLPLEYGSEIDVINADNLSSYLRRGRPSPLFLILGRQSDWQQLVDTGNVMKDLSSLAVVFGTATEPLVSDFDIQRELQIPSVLMFGLTRDFTHQPNSLRLVRPLIDIMSVKRLGRQDSFDLGRMPAKHCLMLREEIRPHYDPREVGSRIGARAIRAGIPVGARIDLFVDEPISMEVGIEWGRLFEPIFAVPYPSERTLQKRSHRPFLTLLADRTEQDSRFDSVREGVVRLLNLRGWSVERHDGRLVISNENRQFSAIFVEKNQDMPAEDSISQRPAFGRSHLLVIHASPNREALLIGNRGQYCHITLEDISLMQPDTQWIWSVLRRQLGRRTTKSLAALRLAALLAAEAIKMRRIEYSAARRGALDQLMSILQADDCERFVNFMTRPPGRAEGFLMRIHVRSLAQDLPVDPELILRIEDDGPTVVIDW